MSIVDLVLKLIVLFTSRVFVSQANVLLGKPRDYRAFQSSLGLPIELLSLFIKSAFLLIRD